jgi:nucleoside-diphosphate-sugar epimerase
MEILLTGSSGFLSNILIKNFTNCNILKLSRTHSDYNIDLSKFTPVFNRNFDLVIHTAGKAHSNPKTQEEINSFNNINFIGTQNLLNGLKNNLPKQFVFISSVSVYGLISGESISETTPLLANDPYGKSKIEAECFLKTWCEENNVTCTILRLPLIVGANPPGNLGAMIQGIKKGYYFNIAGSKARKSMVLIGDVASSILKVAGIGGIYNLTDGYHPTFAELSIFFSNQLGKNNPQNVPFWIAKFISLLGEFIGEKSPINLNKLKKITSELTFDDSKARKAFGWDPTPVLSGFKIN